MAEEIKSFNMPDLGYVTAETAQEEIRKLESASFEQGHPLNPNTSFHPQAKDFVKLRANLFDLVHPPDPEGRSELQINMAEAMESEAQRKADAVSKGTRTMEWLKERGYASQPVTDKTPEYELEGLENQKSLEQGKHEEVYQNVSSDVRRLNGNQQILKRLNGFREAKTDTDKFNILYDAIFWVAAENKKLAEKETATQ